MWDEHFRDFPFFDRFDRSIFPYWRNADHSVLHVANETQQVVLPEMPSCASIGTGVERYLLDLMKGFFSHFFTLFFALCPLFI